VLVDTGPLYAAVDPDDQYHQQAQRELAQLEREELPVLIVSPILLECYSLVVRRLGIQSAHNWLQEVRDASSLVNPVAEDYLHAIRTALAFKDQPVTLFDAVLCVVGRRLLTPIWTYDHQFDVMQANVWR
jgi:predicted nucleic acid-binding protein